jgi:hypothetical protein
MKNKSKREIRGQVGAPQKVVKIPNRPFTMEAAIKLNKCNDGGPCELTVRKRISAALVGFYISNGKKVTVPKTLTKGEPVPQPNGKVGRPKFRFVPLNVVPAAGKPVKSATPKTVKVVTVSPKVSEPTPAIVTNTTTPVTTTSVGVPASVVTPAPLP